jgi:hypothetical protein
LLIVEHAEHVFGEANTLFGWHWMQVFPSALQNAQLVTLLEHAEQVVEPVI